MHDVCIVGAGPAGLNAALILGRCSRQVIVFDSGQPRNAASRGLHGYLTRDGIHPRDLRAFGREEVSKYPSIEFSDTRVDHVLHRDDHFRVTAADGRVVEAKFLLLATGRFDLIPEKPGFRHFYGRGVFHCPYCDGWEHRGQKIVAYGECSAAAELALALLTWSKHVTVCSVDPTAFSDSDRARLEANEIAIAGSPVEKVTGVSSGELSAVHLEDGTTVPCQALFFTDELPQKSQLVEDLGCQLDEEGSVICTEHAATGVPGLYVAGNVRRGVHLAIMAAAEGAEAGIAINEALSDRELQLGNGCRSPQSAV